MSDLLERLEACNLRWKHPVITNALKAMNLGDFDRARYLIINDMDKFHSDEKAWLRENGLLPKLQSWPAKDPNE